MQVGVQQVKSATLLRRAVLTVAILSSAVLVYLVGQLLGWWRLSAMAVVTAIGATTIPILLLWAVFDAAERRQQHNATLSWLVLVLAFLLSAIAILFVV